MLTPGHFHARVFGMSFDAAKKGFFDRRSVLNAMDKVTVKVLSRFGAYVWSDARNSIRSRNGKASKPGKPPTNQTGILKKFIFFSYDKNQRSVVIGPTAANQLSFGRVDGANWRNVPGARPLGGGHAAIAKRGVIPSILEYGGTTDIYEEKIGRNWYRRDNRERANSREKRLRRVHIEARPYMEPAYKKNFPKLPSLWRAARAAN